MPKDFQPTPYTQVKRKKKPPPDPTFIHGLPSEEDPDMAARLGIVEKNSNETLPTGVSLALANSGYGPKQLQRSSVLLARQFDIEPDYLFESTTDVRKGLISYKDPVTGGELSFDSAQRLMKRIEPELISSILEGTTAATFRETYAGKYAKKVEGGEAPPQRIDNERVHRFLLAMGPIHGKGMSFAQAVTYAVDAAGTDADVGVFTENLRQFSAVRGISGGQAVLSATETALRGVRVTSRAQARFMLLPPEGQQAVTQVRLTGQAEKQEAEVVGPGYDPFAGLPEEEEAELEAIEVQRMSLAPALEELGETLLDFVTGREETLLQTTQRLTGEASVASNAWRKGWMGKFWRELDALILEPSYRAPMAAGRFLTLPVEIGQGLIESGKAMDWQPLGRELSDWANDVGSILHGKTTFGREVLGEELGLPEWSHWIGDLAVSIALDPLLVGGRGIRDWKMLRTRMGGKAARFPNARGAFGLAAEVGGVRVPLLGGRTLNIRRAELWPEMMRDFINGNYFTRPAGKGFLRTSPTGGKRFSTFLRETAVESENADDFFAAMDRMGTTTFGHRLLAKQTEGQIFRFIRTSIDDGREVAWIERQVDEVLAHAMGAPVKPGTFAASLEAESHRLQQIEAEILARRQAAEPAIAEMFATPEELSPLGLGPLEASANRTQNILSQVRDWEVTSALGTIPVTMEIPHYSLLHSIGVATRQRFGEAVGAATLRALVNKPPRGTMLWDMPGTDPLEHYKRWAVSGKGVMTDAQIAEDQVELGRLLASSTDPQRELKIARFLEDRNKYMVRRVAEKHGFDLDTAEELINTAYYRGAAKTPDEVFAIRPLRTKAEIEKGLKQQTVRVKEPLFETQFANTYDLLDPHLLDRIFTDAQGVARRMRILYLRALGKSGVSGQASIKVFAKSRQVKDFAVNAFLRIWKPLVVLRPAYIWRVPLLDENLRVLATLGPVARMEAGTMGARMVSRVRRYTAGELTEDGLEDALRFLTAKGPSKAGLGEEATGFVAADYDEARRLVRMLDEGGWDDGARMSAEDLLAREVMGIPRYGRPLAHGGFLFRDGRVVRVLDNRFPVRVKATLPDGTVAEEVLRFQLAGLSTDEALEELAGAGGFANLLRFGGEEATRTAQQLGKRLRKGHGGVIWGEMEPGQSGYEAQWAHLLTRQIGGSSHGNLILRGIAQGKSPDDIFTEVMGFLRGEGQYQATHLMQVENFDQVNVAVLEDRVRQGIEVARYYTGAASGWDDARLIADAAAWGRLEPSMVGAMPDKPLINGMDAAVAFGGPDDIGARFVQRAADLILQRPTNIINRHPYARAWKDKAFRSMIDVARGQGIELTPQLIRNFENQSRSFALTQVRQVLFDFREKQRYQELFSFITPFFQPYTEAFVSWGRIISRNPAALGWANIAGRTMTESGFVTRDPDTGELVIPMPNMWALGPLVWMLGGGLLGAAVRGLAGAAIGTGVGAAAWHWGGAVDLPGAAMSARLSSLNLFVSNAFPIGGTPNNPSFSVPLPGLSPPALKVLQEWVEGDLPGLGWLNESARQRLASWAFEFGPVDIQDMFPPWINNVALGVAGEGWQADRFNDQTVDFLRLQEFMGMPVSPNHPSTGESVVPPPPMRLERPEGGGLYDEPFTVEAWREMTPTVRQEHWQTYRQMLAEEQTKKYFRAQTVVSLFYPAATKTELPFADLRREFSRLAAKHGSREAQEIFASRHPEMIGMSVPGTIINPEAESRVPLPPTPAVNEILAHPEVQRFGAQNPELVWALIPREIREDPDFDPGAWYLAIARGDRQQLAPEEWLDNEQKQLGWGALIPVYEQWQAAQDHFEDAGITSTDGRYRTGDGAWMGEADWEEAKNLIFLLYPEVETQWNSFEAENIPVRVRAFTEKILKDDTFLQTEAGKGLKEYWTELRPGLIEDMEKAGISTIDTKGAEDLGITKRYEDGLESLFEKFPDFETAYYIFYEHDLRGLPNAKDRALESMTPEQQGEFSNLEEQWSTFDYNDIKALIGPEEDQAWIDRRAFIESVYADFPKSQNVVLLDWQSKYPDDKKSALASQSTRSYIYWTRFERGLAGERTTDYAEEVWAQLAAARLSITEADAAAKGRGDDLATGELYGQVDRQLFAKMQQNKVLAEQVRHANDWAWSFETLSPYMMKRNPAHGFWEAWTGAVREVQRVFTERKMQFVGSDPIAQQVYGAMRQYREEVLFAESPLFKRQWTQLEEESDFTDAIYEFVPETYYFPLGGWDAVQQYSPEPVEKVAKTVSDLEADKGPVAVIPGPRKTGPSPLERREARRLTRGAGEVTVSMPEAPSNTDRVIPRHASPEQAQSYARQLAREEYGWDDEEVRALMELGGLESGWRWNAGREPGDVGYEGISSAQGIAQALDDHFGDTWDSPAGQRYLDDAEVQVRWMLSYISQRYERPSVALAGHSGGNLGGPPGYFRGPLAAGGPGAEAEKEAAQRKAARLPENLRTTEERGGPGVTIFARPNIDDESLKIAVDFVNDELGGQALRFAETAEEADIIIRERDLSDAEAQGIASRIPGTYGATQRRKTSISIDKGILRDAQRLVRWVREKQKHLTPYQERYTETEGVALPKRGEEPDTRRQLIQAMDEEGLPDTGRGHLAVIIAHEILHGLGLTHHMGGAEASPWMGFSITGSGLTEQEKKRARRIAGLDEEES